MERVPVVYIMASGRNGTLYTGVASGLLKRIYEHRTKAVPGFTTDHDRNRLIWFEVHAEMESAILREKRIKKWNRAWKLRLIEEANPTWRDLAEDLGFGPLGEERDLRPIRYPCLLSLSSPRRRGSRAARTALCHSGSPPAGMTRLETAAFARMTKG